MKKYESILQKAHFIKNACDWNKNDSSNRRRAELKFLACFQF